MTRRFLRDEGMKCPICKLGIVKRRGLNTLVCSRCKRTGKASKNNVFSRGFSREDKNLKKFKVFKRKQSNKRKHKK